MIKSVTVLGSSSGRNAGDAALISGLMEGIDHELGRKLTYEIPSMNPDFIRKTYPTTAVPIGAMPWNLALKLFGVPTYRSIMRTDLSLVFDAVLFDRALYNPMFNFLSTLHLFLRKAKKQGKQVGFYNVGCGPVHTKRGREMLRDLSNEIDFIAVRDQDSLELLLDIGVTNKRIVLAADAALNVRPSPSTKVDSILNKFGIGPSEEFLALNVNTYLDTWATAEKGKLTRERFVSEYSEAINRFLAKYEVPVLFVVTYHADLSLTEEIVSKLRSKKPVKVITNIDYSHHDIQGVLSRAQLLFAMRLHAMILASSQHTPILGLAYQPKCAYYFRELGMPDRSIDFKDFAVSTLSEGLNRAWEERGQIRTKLDERIPLLKQEALKAAKLVAGLSAGEDMDALVAKLNGQGELQRRAATV
jgi:polysaccharide pyruvyl transferase WcaK-like protein